MNPNLVGFYRIEQILIRNPFNERGVEFIVHGPEVERDTPWTACNVFAPKEGKPWIQVGYAGRMDFDCAGAMAECIQMAREWVEKEEYK